MELLAFVLAVIAAFYAGYKYERITRELSNLKESIKQKIDRKPPEQEKSTFIDPLDPITQAKMEHEEMMRKLNPYE